MKLTTLQKRIAIGILGVIFLGLLYSIYYSLFVFHITKTTPSNQNYPSSLGNMTIYFNQKLNTDALRQKIQTNPKQIINPSFNSEVLIKVEDDHITVTFSQVPKTGNYKLSISNIEAVNGSIITTDLGFIVKNIEYKDLNAADKKQFDEEALSGEELPNDPIISVLPYETDDYKIAYSFPLENSTIPARVIITMKFYEPGDTALAATAQQKLEYLARVRKYTNQALDYLRSKNTDLNKYVLDYTEPELRAEFPKGYVASP